MPKHAKTVTIDSFKGLNNTLPPERTDPAYLKEVNNIDIDKSGGLHKRKGYSLVDSGNYHSLWSDGEYCYAVKGTDLVNIDTDLNVTVIESDFTSDKVSFERIEDYVYYSGQNENGIIEPKNANYRRDWGIQWLNPQPVLTDVAGGMYAGRYQVAVTAVDDRGVESGVGVPQYIDVTNGGINVAFTGSSSTPTVVSYKIYVTEQNGNTLYYFSTVDSSTTDYTIGDVTTATYPCEAFNMQPPPRGHIVRYAHSRMFVAADNILWFSEPFAYEWFNYHENYLYFPERIRAVMPTDGGMWIAADKLYYLAGKDPNKATLSEKEPVKVVEGSDVKIVGAYIFIENTPIGYKWLVTSDKGIYVCYNDGVTINMTEKNVTMPPSDRGTATFVQEDGINRYVTLLQKRGENNNMAVGDQVTATIIRNGVVVEE